MKGGGNKIQTEDKRICILAMFSRVKKLKINQIANRRIDRLIMLYVLNIPYNNGNKWIVTWSILTNTMLIATHGRRKYRIISLIKFETWKPIYSFVRPT